MKSYSYKHKREIKTPKNVKDFLDEIEQLCRKYDLSISHEDGHGGFIIEKFTEYNLEWLKNASLNNDTSVTPTWNMP